MSYPRIHQKIFNEPWLIEPTAYDSVRSAFLNHQKRELPQFQALPSDSGQPRPQGTLAGVSISPYGTDPSGSEVFAITSTKSTDPNCFFDLGEPATRDRKPYDQNGSIAIVPIQGIIGKRLSSLEMMCGGVDVDTVKAAIDAAFADDSIDTVLLSVDSPGGTVTGVPELATHLAALADSGQKEIVAYTDTLNASAAYFISSQAHRVFASPSSRTGSIGTVITLANQVEYDKKIGVEYTTITTGKFKDLGNPHREMTGEEFEILKAEAFAINAEFVAAVATARDMVAENVESLEARVYRGQEAIAAGLVDDLFPSIGALIAELA